MSEVERYIFIFGHMRGRTSLLAHLLGSHPDIIGYAELHQSYSGIQDLERMKERIIDMNPGKAFSRYWLDKILYDHYPIAQEILYSEPIYPIFILRPPQPTIESYIRNIHLEVELKLRFIGGMNAYLSRLKGLARLAAGLTRPGLLVDAEQLVDQPQKVLPFVQEYLGLQSTLSVHYEKFLFTGRPGYGDTSPTLQRGEIVSERSTEQWFQPSKQMRALLEDAYRKCLLSLQAHCRHL